MDFLKKLDEFFYIDQHRAGRKEYILGSLKIFIISLLCIFLIGYLADVTSDSISVIFIPITTGIFLLLSIGGIRLDINRFHDLGKSGWRTLTTLIPYIGIIVNICLACIKGDEGKNEYGMPYGESNHKN